MSERIQYPTVADTRDALDQIITAATAAREYTGLYEAVYADDISEELVLALEHIASVARGAAKRQSSSHERVAALADSVTADLERLPVAGDLLMSPPEVDSVWPEASDVDFGPLVADHDAAQADWMTEEDDQ
ncbi:hypothetical protein ABZ249_30295 [Nocardiopsis sp. NPDC006139]|uniref:hypothetical protein n=1 Tax=Nocardiopsis sp. NPDC006139 TaxID=3154578 RepID=UPI0033A309CC